MPRLQTANNATTTIPAALTAVATSFTVANASVFPNAPFRVTIDNEIMEVGAIDKVGNTLSSVLRGLEGTTAASHNSGTAVDNRWTSGTYAELASDIEMSKLRIRSYAGVF